MRHQNWIFRNNFWFQDKEGRKLVMDPCYVFWYMFTFCRRKYLHSYLICQHFKAEATFYQASNYRLSCNWLSRQIWVLLVSHSYPIEFCLTVYQTGIFTVHSVTSTWYHLPIFLPFLSCLVYMLSQLKWIGSSSHT